MKPPTPRAGTVPWRSCPDCPKHGYDSRSDAKKVLRRVDPHMAIYRCTSGLWHMGHRVPGLARAEYPSQRRRTR